MYVRDFESYKSKKNSPLIIWILSQYLIFSLILSIIFTIIIPIKSSENFAYFDKNSLYFLQTNLFFINFELNKGDLVILNQNKNNTQNIFFSQFLKILTFNLNKNNIDYRIYEIIGLPHDLITIKDGVLYINSKQEISNISTSINKDSTFYLEKDQYYCISTDINSLDDSLFIGIIEKDKVFGKIIKNLSISLKNE